MLDFLKNYSIKIKDHILYWSEIYILPIISIIALVIAIYGINFWTGKPILDSPDSIVGWLYNLIGVNFVIIATGISQHILYGYRNKKSGGNFRNDIFDAVITTFLLILWSICLWR